MRGPSFVSANCTAVPWHPASSILRAASGFVEPLHDTQLTDFVEPSRTLARSAY